PPFRENVARSWLLGGRAAEQPINGPRADCPRRGPAGRSRAEPPSPGSGVRLLPPGGGVAAGAGLGAAPRPAGAEGTARARARGISRRVVPVAGEVPRDPVRFPVTVGVDFEADVVPRGVAGDPSPAMLHATARAVSDL